MSPIIDLLLGPVLQLVEKYIPSAEDRAKLQVELLQLQQNQQLKELDAQLQIATAQPSSDLACTGLLQTDPVKRDPRLPELQAVDTALRRRCKR